MEKLTLEEAKKKLEDKGLKPIDYKHLTYKQLIELAAKK
jgi:hypothetical protein